MMPVVVIITEKDDKAEEVSANGGMGLSIPELRDDVTKLAEAVVELKLAVAVIKARTF